LELTFGDSLGDFDVKQHIFLLALFASICFFSCDKFREDGATDIAYNEYEDTSLAKIIVKGKLVVGVMDYAPPCAFKDTSGKMVGFDVDIFREVASRLDVDVEFKVINWGLKDELLDEGEIDCIASAFTISKSRQLSYALTMPTLYNAQVAVVKKASNIYDIKDLNDKTIGILDNSNVEEVLKEAHNDLSFKKVVEYSSFLTSIEDLQMHAVDAVFIDLLIINYMMRNNPTDFRILDSALTSEKYTYAFRRGDKLLRDAVEKIMLELEYEGRVLEASKKWFAGDIYLFGR